MISTMQLLERDFYPLRETLVTRGIDSTVYRAGRYAVKEYHSLAEVEARRYMDFTNEVALSTISVPHIQNVDIGDDKWQASVMVMPILEVDKSAAPPRRTIAVSYFVPGPNFAQMRRTFQDITPFVMDLDKDEQDFLVRFKKMLEDQDF